MKETLRILHFTTDGEPIAGAERLLIDIARHGRRLGWALRFVVLRGRGALHEAAEECGWPTDHLDAQGMKHGPGAVIRLRRMVREWKPDILHTHLHHASVLGSLAKGPALLIQTRHYANYMTRFGNRIERVLDVVASRRAARVIAVSDAARAHLVLKEGVRVTRVATVANGVDVERLKGFDARAGRAILTGWGLGVGPFVGCAATYHPWKGHEVLLRAFKLVAGLVPTARLILLGQGPGEAEIVATIRQLGLETKVGVLGYQRCAQEIMAALDVYVQPSIEEGFGLAVVEAMAMRRPVVVSDVGGMRETVEDGVSGLRVAPGDAPSLAGAILRVLREPTVALQLGEAAAVRAADRYSLARMLAQYDACYRDALRLRGAG